MGFEIFAKQNQSTPPSSSGSGFGAFANAQKGFNLPNPDASGFAAFAPRPPSIPFTDDAMRAVKGDIRMPDPAPIEQPTADSYRALKGDATMDDAMRAIHGDTGMPQPVDAERALEDWMKKNPVTNFLYGISQRGTNLIFNGGQPLPGQDLFTSDNKYAATAQDLLGYAALPLNPGAGLVGAGENAAGQALSKFAPNLGATANKFITGAAGQAALGAGIGAQDAGVKSLQDPNYTFGQALGDIGANAAMFGGTDAALRGLGMGLKAGADKLGITDAFRNAVDRIRGRAADTTAPIADVQTEPLNTPTIDAVPTRASMPSALRANDAKQAAMQEFEQGVEKVRNYLGHDDLLAAYPEGTTIDAALKDIHQNTGVDLHGLLSKVETTSSRPLSSQLKTAADVSRLGRAAGAIESRPVTAKSIDDVVQRIRSQKQPSIPEGVQGFAANNLQFRNAPVQTARTISRNQVVKNMRKNLGVVIDTGRLSSKGTLGEFKVRPEVIRSRQAEDIQVISHEIGHNLDKRFKLSEPHYQQELVNLINQVNPGHLANYQPNQHLEESIAEYVRLRLTDPQKAEQLAPAFTKFFDSKLPPKARKGFEATQKDIDTWITQGEYARAKGKIEFESKQKPKFSYDNWYSKYVDDLNPLKIAEKALKGKVGLGDESIYKMARLSRGIGERAKLAITRGIYDDSGNKIGEGLAEIVKPLEKMGVSEKDFSTYLAVKHAEDLKAMGKEVPFTDGEISAVLRKLDSPEMQAVQKKIVEYNNHLTDILVDAQILTKEAVQAMRQKYPNYVPFMRYFDDDAIAGFKNGGFGGAKGFANLTNPIKRMSEEGSQRTIINPLESMVNNTFLVMNAATKNKVGLQLADLSKIDGAGAWVEHLGEGGRNPKEHIVTVYQNGKPNQYKVRDPELHNAMLSLDTESTNSLIKFLGSAASLLRAGATLTPEFILRNPMRDIVGSMVNVGYNPIDFFKGLVHVVGKTDTFNKFLSSGGAMSTLMSLDREANREALKKVFAQSFKDKALNVVTSPKELAKMLSGYTPLKATIGGLRHLSETTELATKVGRFNKLMKKTGDINEAAYQARDLMDFNRSGSNIRQANRAVAFMNAAIQGSDKFARSFWGNGPKDIKSKAGFITRAFTTLVLPSVGLYYWNNNLPPDMKKLYDNIPQWQKDSFFIIGIPGSNTFVRIPKPFEAGMLFATGTDRVMRWMQDHDPQAFKDYGQTVLQSFTPPVMLTSLSPLLEAITNHSFFQNRDIVPMGEQRLTKEDQFGINTSLTARAIGKLMGQTPLKDSNFASPRIIDNTIKGYTAGLGQYAVSGIDSLLGNNGIITKAPQPAKTLAEQPFVKAFTVSTSGGGQVRDDFYKRWDELSQEKASAAKNNLPYTNPEYARLQAAKQGIDQFTKLYKAVQADKNMNPDEKRAKLDLLDEKMNQISAWGLNRK